MTISEREKRLLWIVGGIAALFLNLILFSALAHRNTALRTQLAARRADLAQINALLGIRDDWAAKEAALTAKQPKMSNENAAGVQLDDMINDLAKKQNINVENEVIGSVTKTTYYNSVPVSLDTHSSWPALIAFLYSLQKPDQFIVCESANIQVDPGDQTKMLGHFKIARWFAP